MLNIPTDWHSVILAGWTPDRAAVVDTVCGSCTNSRANSSSINYPFSRGPTTSLCTSQLPRQNISKHQAAAACAGPAALLLPQLIGLLSTSFAQTPSALFCLPPSTQQSACHHHDNTHALSQYSSNRAHGSQVHRSTSPRRGGAGREGAAGQAGQNQGTDAQGPQLHWQADRGAC